MTFMITLQRGSIYLEMPGDKGLRLFEACHRAELYKKKNPQAIFSVVNEENGDIEYQI